GDLEALPALDGLDELRRLEEGFMRARVQPRHAAAHWNHFQLAALEVGAVHVGDLQFAARRRLEPRSDLHDPAVVEVQADDGIPGLGLLRLFLDAQRLAASVEFDDAVALRVGHRIGEDRGALVTCRGPLEQIGKVVAIEDVVPEYQRNPFIADEVAADQERLRDAFGLRLYCVMQADAPFPAVAEQLLEAGRVLGGRDDQDVPDAGEHQRRQRVVDHGLVVNRQKLLREHLRHRVKPRSCSAGQDDALHAARLATASLHALLSRYQRTVLRMPEANVSRGSQPSSHLILVASIAYRRSWPKRSLTKVTRSAYLPFLRGSASSRRSQMVSTTSLL